MTDFIKYYLATFGDPAYVMYAINHLSREVFVLQRQDRKAQNIIAGNALKPWG